MKQWTQKWILGIGTSLTLGLAAIAVLAHSGPMAAGMSPDGQGSPHRFSNGDMGRSAMRPIGKGTHAAQQLMAPEERAASQARMWSSKIPEERQQIATVTRSEMEQRTKDRGILLPEHRGRHGNRPNTAAPATGEHAH